MRQFTNSKLLLLLLLPVLLIFLSCKEPTPKVTIKLTNIPENKMFFIDQEVEFQGKASSTSIKEAKFFINEEEIEIVQVKEKIFSFKHTFTEVTYGIKMKLSGLDSKKKSLASKTYEINAIEEPVMEILNIQNGEEFDMEEEAIFSGKTSDNIKKVEIFYNSKSIGTPAIEENEFSLAHKFNRPSKKAKLKFSGYDLHDNEIITAEYEIVVIGEFNPNSEFSFDEPTDEQISKRKTLWATWYNLPISNNLQSGYSMRSMSGKKLGPIVSRHDWCYAAMEGSVIIKNEDGSMKTYNYAGTSSSYTVDCKSYFGWKMNLSIKKTKFRVANGPYGDGVKSYYLVPFRTIAVDKSVIPYGTVIYIPDAREKLVTLPDGSEVYHDGYFFAGDTGGAIKGNHIDVFIGTETSNAFPSWVKSSSSKTFQAYVIKDQEIIDTLTERHKTLD